MRCWRGQKGQGYLSICEAMCVPMRMTGYVFSPRAKHRTETEKRMKMLPHIYIISRKVVTNPHCDIIRMFCSFCTRRQKDSIACFFAAANPSAILSSSVGCNSALGCLWYQGFSLLCGYDRLPCCSTPSHEAVISVEPIALLAVYALLFPLGVDHRP